MDFEEQLIEEVRNAKCLYETKSRSNKNKTFRMDAWMRVSAKVGRPVNDCKQRWRSLRDRYVRERKKMALENNSSTLERWELYDLLTFLDAIVRPKRHPPQIPFVRDSNCYEESDQSMQSTSQAHTAACTDTKESFDVTDIFLYDDSVETTAPTSNILPHSPKDANLPPKVECTIVNTPMSRKSKPDPIEIPTQYDPRHSPPTTSKRSSAEFKDANQAFLELIAGIRTAMESRLVVEKPEKDENDMFLEWIGKKMKNLPETAKLRIQGNLLSSVTKELLKE